MVRIIEYSKPIISKIKDFLFEHYIAVSACLLIFIILAYRFRNRKERIMKREMQKLEFKQYLQNIVYNNQQFENQYVNTQKEYQNYPENQNFEYNPDITHVLEYTPSQHPDAFHYEEEPMISYNDPTNNYYSNNYQQQYQQNMDNYFYH